MRAFETQETMMTTSSKGTVSDVTESQLRERLSGPENRTTPRVPANLSVDLPLVDAEQAKRVYTRNISKGGLLFTVPSPATMAATVHLNLTLPNGKTVSFDSEVRHVSRSADGANYEVGVQFRLDAAQQKMLDDAIASLSSSGR
jgi:hypothetical protein